MVSIPALSLRSILLLAIYTPLCLTVLCSLGAMLVVLDDHLNVQIQSAEQSYHKEWKSLIEGKCAELGDSYNILRNNKELLESLRADDKDGIANNYISAWNQLQRVADIMFFWSAKGRQKLLLMVGGDKEIAMGAAYTSNILNRVTAERRMECSLDYSPDGHVRLLRVTPIFNTRDRSYIMFVVGVDLSILIEKMKENIGAEKLYFSEGFFSTIGLQNLSQSHIDWQQGQLHFSLQPTTPYNERFGIIHGYMNIESITRHSVLVFISFALVILVLSVTLGTVFASMLLKRVMTPLEQCLDISSKIERGECVGALPIKHQDEISMISRSLLELMARMKFNTEELARSEQRLASLISMLPMLCVEVDNEGVVRQWNLMAESLLGIPRTQAVGSQFLALSLPCDVERIKRSLNESRNDVHGHHMSKVACGHNGGQPLLLDMLIASAPWCGPHAFIILGRDVTDQVQMEIRLSQAQKLEAIGTLAAGIAHEINTPIQFIGDNTHFLRDAFTGLDGIIGKWHQLYDGDHPMVAGINLIEEAQRAEKEGDLDFLRYETPMAIDQILQGVMRISVIVRAMKDFSYSDQGESTQLDINKALQDTIVISRNEYKYVADVETHFDPDLPMIVGFRNELNQAFLNILVNAAHAIQEKKELGVTDERGIITITTERDEENVIIVFTDTGIGIPARIRERIFEPFFTTKPVGKGSGQGLSIVHSVIHGKHGGTLTVDSQEQVGSSFTIHLPINGKNSESL